MSKAWAQLGGINNSIVTSIIMAENKAIADSFLGDAVYIEDWAEIGWIYNKETNTFSKPEGM